jgi:cytochrome c oxidase subunit 1
MLYASMVLSILSMGVLFNINGLLNIWKLKPCNHKRIGIYYLGLTVWTGASGTMLSIIIRTEIDLTGHRIIQSCNFNLYNLILTLHGLLMIFFLIMPIMIGSYGNILTPIIVGCSEVGYPRVNNMSLLIAPYSYAILSNTIINEFGNGMGWTLYPPLSTKFNTLSYVGVNLIIYGLLFSGISSSLTSINIFSTEQNIRCFGLTLRTIP